MNASVQIRESCARVHPKRSRKTKKPLLFVRQGEHAVEAEATKRNAMPSSRPSSPSAPIVLLSDSGGVYDEDAAAATVRRRGAASPPPKQRRPVGRVAPLRGWLASDATAGSPRCRSSGGGSRDGSRSACILVIAMLLARCAAVVLAVVFSSGSLA